MRFTLEIRMDNAAFDDPFELARIVREIANDVNENQGPCHAQSVHDVNGNRVGQWKVTEDA